MIWLALIACVKPTIIDPAIVGGPVIDIHTHCPLKGPCDPTPSTNARDGQITAVAAGLTHYSIAEQLGDPIPAEMAGAKDNNDAVLQATGPQLIGFASLECLAQVPGDAPDFTAQCLADVQRWSELGIRGFKDHAGKTYGDGLDQGRWVGAYNRLAGWCLPTPGSTTPNRDCLAQETMRFPLSVDAYREVIRAVVDDYQMVYLTHATPWEGSDEQCAGQPCHDAAVDALLDFVSWSVDTITDEGRSRVVLAHAAFLENNPSALTTILDAGFTVDLAQTDFLTKGCEIRELVAAYPDQVVFGTDLFQGKNCIDASYESWMYALLGPAGESAKFKNTCRGTVKPVGAGLADPAPGVCGIAVQQGAGRKVLYDNAARLLQLD